MSHGRREHRLETAGRRPPRDGAGPAGRNLVLWSSLLIVAASFIAYGNSLSNGFAYDDDTLIVQNPVIRSISGVVSTVNLYRPVRWLTFALDYRLWKLDPTGYHLTNVLMHAACALLVFWVMRLLVRSTIASLAIALLFCVHPIATEAVDNVSNRNELLGTFFSLCAFGCYMQRDRSRWWSMAVLPFHLVALLSKEAIAVSLPLAYIAYDFYFRRNAAGRLSFRLLWPGFAYAMVSALAIAFAYAAFRIDGRAKETYLYLSGSTFVNAGPTLISLDIWVRAMAKGILLILFPRNLSADYPIPRIESLVDGAFIGSALVVACLIAAVIVTARRSRLASFGLLWMFVFLLPTTNIVPITLHFMAERYLYAPSIGFCLAIGVLLLAIYENRVRLFSRGTQKAVAVSLLAMFVVLSLRSDWMRNREWKSDYTIWTRTAAQQPESPIAWINVGKALQNGGKLEESVTVYKKIVALFEQQTVGPPRGRFTGREASKRALSLYASALNNIASVDLKLKRYPEAIGELQKAVSACPSHYLAYYNLGVAYINQGDMDGAIASLVKSIAIYDAYGEAHRALSYAYEQKGMSAEAEKERETAKQCAPATGSAL